MSKNVLWITRTAIFTALIIVTQAVTAPLGNTLITGSGVNLILVISVMLSGILSGLSVAALSPIFAKIFGIGPLWSFIPFIVAGNMSLVLIWYLIGNIKLKNRYHSYAVATVFAAIVKFTVLYFGIVKVAVPIVLQLPEPQATTVSAAFSFPQLITALVGGAIASVILPVLDKAVRKTSSTV